MQWSELMEKVYRSCHAVVEIVLAWCAALVVLSEELLQIVLSYLGQLGVPEEQQLMVFYACLYGVATLLVLLLTWRVVRRRSRKAKGVATVEPLVDVVDKVRLGDAAGEPQLDVRSEPVAEQQPASIFERMKAGLSKTQAALLGRVDALFGSASVVDTDFLEELEEILITADFGMKTTQLLIDAFKRRVVDDKIEGAQALRGVLKEEILRLMTLNVAELDIVRDEPFVLLVIGVNGVGKTTTVGKLAHLYSGQGKKVILGAADTFRAAAADQLSVWGERTGVSVIRHNEGSDPAAVAFDSVKAAVARNADILILDTAGRLHTKVNLMEEMKKIRRVMQREVPQAPHETLLVLDATTGQNALVQARLFQEAIGITGIAITKLDGTAKGGMAVAIGVELGLPVRFIGVGEGVDDLRPFDPEIFVDALFENH
ncbi:MAG: signal recognition particle-docking protein FtsY [Thermodesulfobacteriota bacterium]|nr:signal recognition particle-docking protein FtsY [Thermodesulfobacteriota bacterium]